MNQLQLTLPPAVDPLFLTRQDNEPSGRFSKSHQAAEAILCGGVRLITETFSGHLVQTFDDCIDKAQCKSK